MLSAQRSIASAKFLFLRQSPNLSQHFPFNFCSFPTGQGKTSALGRAIASPHAGVTGGNSAVTRLVPAGDHGTLRSTGKAKTQLRSHSAPRRDFISPLLSKELEADPTPAFESRSRSCIAPQSQAGFPPALHQQGAGEGLFLRIFMQLQPQKH